MRKRRIFAPSLDWSDDHIKLDKSQSHHVKDVLRLKTGSCLTCFDETGRTCETRIQDIQDDVIYLRILEIKPVSEKKRSGISLAQSIVKSNSMDLIVQKCAELGVVEIIPFISDHSVIKLDEKRKENKINRWKKIAVEAVKQSGSPHIPDITEIAGFDRLIELSADYDMICVAHPYSDQFDLTKKIAEAKKILLVIGPEGGFSDSETGRFCELHNSFMWSFHDNILRAETAAVSALSILTYEMNKNSDE